MNNDIKSLFCKVKIEEPQITVNQISDNEGVVTIEPLLRGYGTTIGNSLRRVMLSSLPGSAVSSITISANGTTALHEMSTLPGVKEDVCEIVLNVKGIIAKLHSDTSKVAYIDVTKAGVITAADIKCDDTLTIINPEQPIATLVEDGSFRMELTFNSGVGYVSADKNKAATENAPLGVIFVDSIFTPVRSVNYTVDNTRVGSSMDYDKLTVTIVTNGSLSPSDAVVVASQILKEHFSLISAIGGGSEEPSIISKGEEAIKAESLNMSIDELELSVRSFNCLKRAGINTVSDIISRTADETIKIRNLGRKSFEEISNKLASMGLAFKSEIG